MAGSKNGGGKRGRSAITGRSVNNPPSRASPRRPLTSRPKSQRITDLGRQALWLGLPVA
jgi:hypothetical protein